MKILIIGNGAAGVAAAEAIKQRKPDYKITILTDEPYLHYSRPRVIEFLGGKINDEQLVIKKQEWYDSNNIELRTNVKVSILHAAAKEVTLLGGEKISADKIVIAAGAHSFIPPFEGHDLEGVSGLRTIDDAKRLISAARGKPSAVAIGGGLLGIEAAISLVSLGLKITVVEFFQRLLPRQLDSDGAAILKKLLEAKGLEFRLGEETKSVAASEGGLRVEFKSGGSTQGAIVLVSAGVRPNTAFLKDSGIEINKGVKVNEKMETSAEGIYACGDIAEHNGALYGIWPAAREQGTAAGLAIAGEEAQYKGSVMSTKLKVAGIEVASIGRIEEGPGDEITKDSKENIYKKVIRKEGKIAGAILLGDTSEFNALKKEAGV